MNRFFSSVLQAILLACFCATAGYSQAMLTLTTTRNTNCNTPCGNGSIVPICAGCLPPVQYTISPQCNATTFSTAGFSPLLHGTYTVTAVASNGTFTASNTVLPPTPINTGLVVYPPTSSNGSAAVHPSGGVGPYNKLWLPIGTTTDSLGNVPNGPYSVTIIDAQGCTGASAFTLQYPSTVTSASNATTSIFPNPCSNTLFIETTSSINQIELYNISGNCVFKKVYAPPLIAIDMMAFAKGNYLLVLNSKAVRMVVKE